MDDRYESFIASLFYINESIFETDSNGKEFFDYSKNSRIMHTIKIIVDIFEKCSNIANPTYSADIEVVVNDTKNRKQYRDRVLTECKIILKKFNAIRNFFAHLKDYRLEDKLLFAKQNDGRSVNGLHINSVQKRLDQISSKLSRGAFKL